MPHSPNTPTNEADSLSVLIALLKRLDAIAQLSQIDRRSLQQTFLEAQQLYQTRLLPQMAVSSAATPFVSYQTEINRAFRLLGMDVSFLQSAKNPLTVQKRQIQMQQRLKTLLEFCRGLQAAISDT